MSKPLEPNDPPSLELTRRKWTLDRLIPATSTMLSQVFMLEERAEELFTAAQRLDLEGILAKRKSDHYSPHTVWYEIKNKKCTQAEGRRELFDKGRGGERRSSANIGGRL